ncbi:tape measure protein [Campylobacter showae]|uniref:tape measure protein n=1 Tax=Campylobacter showae TaxID=204 RepID=UPI000F0735E7|nr:tape measure protein [Campylobacter showae]
MTETASLIVSARVEGADKLKSDLNSIGSEAKKAEKSAQGLANSFTGLKVAIAAVASSAMLREFVRVADDMSLVNSRLKMATSSAAEYAKQQKALHAIARDTHADIKETINLYAKLAPALKNIGKSTEDTNNMVSSFTKALQLGGASAEEAAAAIKQFGQAMGSGALRGDEFNSIAEASPTLLRYMAEGLGVNVGKLRELGSEGKLTAEALSSAFEKVKNRIDSDFAQMPVTVGKAFTDLRTEINLIVGNINEVSGATQTISGAITSFANALKENKDTIIGVVSGIGTLIKHLGILGGSYLALKGSMAAYAAMTKTVAATTSAGVIQLTLMDRVLMKIGATVNVLKATFASFWPTLAIWAAVEGFIALKDSLNENKVNADELTAALSKTNEQIKQLTAQELQRDLRTLQKEQRGLLDNIERIEDALGRLDEEINDETLRDNAFNNISAGADKFRDKLEKVNEQIRIVNAQLGIVSDSSSANNHFKGAINSLDELKKKYGNVETEFSLYEKLETLKKDLSEVDKVSYLDGENIKKQYATRAAILQEIAKTEEKISNLGKEGSNKASAEAKRRAEELKRLDAQRLDDKIRYYEQIGDIEKANSAKLIKYEKELNEAVKRGGITRLEAAAQLEAKRKELNEKGLKDETERVKKQDALYLDYYITLEKYDEAWQIKRKEYEADYQKLVKEFGKEFAEKWLKQKESSFKKSIQKDVKTVKTAFKDIKNSWADTVSSMQKTVDDGFFNFFIGKTKSLKTALKDIGTNLMRDLISPYARTLSQGISGGFGALLGGGSNLASVAAGLGLAKNDRGGWDGAIGGTTVELSSTGQILRGADALDKSTTNLLGSISNLKTAYDTFTGGIASGFAKAGGYLANAGFGGAGAFTHGFGNGIGTLFGAGNVPAGMTPGITSGMGGSYLGAGTTIGTSPYYTAGTAAGGAMVGGAVGYGIGTGLDKAFGAQTYAPYTGAAAGAAVGGYAAIAGSLSAVPVWGWIAAAVVLAIGGMIGKSKITDWGYQVGQDLSLGLDKGLDGGVNNWKEKTKKSWFSKSVSNQTSPIDEQTQKMLNQYVRTNSVLLRDFTGGNFNLPARTYNKRTLIDEGFGGALIAGVMGKNYDKALSFGGNEGELEKTYRYWMEQAKQDKKETYDLLAEYVGKINSNIKALKLESLNNSLARMKFAKDEAMDALKTLNAGLGAFSGEIEYIGKDMAGQIEKAYREALKNDFSKETVQRYEALTEAYKKAKQAQDDYLKAILNFTQSIAGAQGGFYQALGFDTNFLTLQNLYTRLRNIAGALESDLDDKEKSDVAKIGNSNDPRVWAKYFHDMGSAKLQEFLATGNVEMRAELVKLAAEYRTFTAANGGRDVWLKSFSDIEAITKQIAALKLAEAAQNTLNLQREQLNILNKQKSVLEKVAQTAQRLRDSVIDENTSGLNYRFALERARIAYNAKDYDSKAYENLNTAVAKQEQYLKQTAGSYAEYKLSILKMASEIEGITGAASLDDINRQIKRLEGLLNSSSNSQLSALEAQKEALIKGASDQINAMELLLGSDSPIVRYLKEALAALKDGKAVPNYNGTIANVNNGAVTANGAVLSSQLDRDINAIYKDVLGRSVEQSGLDAWKRKALMENLSLPQIREQIIKTATAITGSSNKNDWIEWSKRQGLKPYAQGGIVTRPTRALIGEAGAEAVIPLKNGAVRAQIVGASDNGEQTRLMREFVSVGKELLKYAKDSATIQKDTTNGQAVVVTIDNLEQILRKAANQ